MSILNIFTNNVFSVSSLTDAIDRMEHKPGFLGTLGLFTPKPITTIDFGVEERDGALSLIQTSQRGARGETGDRRRRRIRSFRTLKLEKGTTISAGELQGVRAFGSESQLETIASLVDDRLAGDDGLVADMELTWEYHRLGALRGEVYDADGSLLFNWWDEFGLTPAAEVNFALGTPTTKVRQKCTDLIRAMSKASKGLFGPGAEIHALTGDAFFDALVEHPEVVATYQNWMAAEQLRRATIGMGQGGTWGSFKFGGITFHNYRGTDDGTRVFVDTDKAHFFPVGARGVFAHVQSPGESLDLVNTLGRPMYARTIPDDKRNEYVEVEVSAYPLFICMRPDVLMKARRA